MENLLEGRKESLQFLTPLEAPTKAATATPDTTATTTATDTTGTTGTTPIKPTTATTPTTSVLLPNGERTNTVCCPVSGRYQYPDT